MINFTAGTETILSTCHTAQIKTLITSQKFIDAYELENCIQALQEADITLIILENIREQISALDKITGIFSSFKRLPGFQTSTDKEAVVLFTSGSEGAPKGVVLSHSNILGNIAQISAMLSLLPQERVFNAMPCFHSFGLTAGLLWPILRGAHVFMYPTPLHYKIIPELVYQFNAHIIFGTDSFLNGYAQKADAYDFYSLKALVAGAERLKPETEDLFHQQFKQPIYQGYGVTECAPVISVNIPTHSKRGSVGQLIPAMNYRLDPIEGIDEGGRLWVQGPNVMKGYLKSDQPGILQPTDNQWHDTGDVVTIDEEGYLWIKGRVKRFAKIAGEMVSLTRVETFIQTACPEKNHSVISLPDAKRGEKLVLVTEDSELNRKLLRVWGKQQNINELMIPKEVVYCETIPLLGSGKVNWPEVTRIAEAALL
jgi:acyl-[acyl-carrier-protein]-phospholipid O-acyltransferase/long-chain-fatty-acid--[acyl-carrier-protein] ligase